jgi:hypothetical protein
MVLGEVLMQAAISLPVRHRDWADAVQGYVRSRLTWVNLLRVGLATMAVIAIPFDEHRRILGPAPNWPLIVSEPVLLIAYLRCTLGSIR